MSLGRPSPAPRSDAWLLALAAMVAAWFYFGTAMEPYTPWFTREPEGYYGLQTAGFRAGHLSAAINPQPALLSLSNPYDPVANAPYRVHDMSLYRGHYYLYFGASPVLIAFWPCVALTGWYPTEPLVVAAFCTGATWLGFALLGAMRRRYFPGAPTWVLGLGAACLMFANPLTHLVQRPQFYQVAGSGAIFLQMAMLAALYCALHSERRASGWLAIASGLFGLDVGARPSFLPGGMALAIAAGGLGLRMGRGMRPMRLVGLLAAAVLPAAAFGVGLMLYNRARFGSVFEFGLRYQLAGETMLNLRPIQPRLIVPHLRAYLFNPGVWSDYFPFFDGPPGQPYGFLRFIAWGWLAPCALLSSGQPESAERGRCRAFVLIVAAVMLGTLVLLASYFYTVERYACDFTTTWLLLSGIGGLAVGHRAVRHRCRRGANGLLGVAAFGSLYFGLAVFVSHAPGSGLLLAAGRVANWPGYAWRRIHGEDDGALRLTLELATSPPPGSSDPVFETGRNAGQCDWLQLDYLSDHRARVSFHQPGLPVFTGDSFPLPADRRLLIEARCGSLLPPFEHPAFAGWTRDEYAAAKRELQVSVNGVERLHATLLCFESSPADLVLGRLDWPAEGVTGPFSGRIVAVARKAPERISSRPPPLTTRRPVRLKIRLPLLHGQRVDPILVTGEGTRSDLLYCSYEADGRIRFALDHFGGGGPQSEALTCDRTRSHQLTIWMGSLADAATSTASPAAAAHGPEIPWSRRLVVAFDGRTVLNTEQEFYPGNPATALIGINAYGSTISGRQFEGRVEEVVQVDFASLPPFGMAGAYGAIELAVEFPWSATGRHEPLVVTGQSGAGDFLYVIYVDSKHVAFGFDDWGTGGIVGAPVEVDYAQAHRLSLTMGSLYPPGGDASRATLVRVMIDGRVALLGRSSCNPSTPAEIHIGKNPIGGSTCEAMFSGRVLVVERPGALEGR